MLSNREKEIIRNVYISLSKRVYSSSGPSFLSSEDYEEISSFLNSLKRKNHSTCIYSNTKIDPSTHRLPYKCNLLPGKPIDCEKCKYYNTKKDCSNCKYGCYNDIFNQYFCYNDSVKCENWNKWEARI